MKREAARPLLQEPCAAPAPDPIAHLKPEQISGDFDFATFLRSDVSCDVRRAVLRRLWQSSPELFKPDGLDIYCEDYNAPSRLLSASASLRSIREVLASASPPATPDAELDAGATEAPAPDAEPA